MKFGGTSVADIPRIRNVARHVKREVDAGHEVAVVVSAMAGFTNQLVAWTREAAPMHDAREYDTVVAAGEQISTGLLAIALQEIGVNARSWLGWQIPIHTDTAHGAARIVDIEGKLLIERLGQGQVAVVAGFQGVAPDNRVATLGRGGSDTSAVALAAALGADRCDIYTDVDGVYTTDPRIVPKATRMPRIAYEEMLEMASLGAKVLQVRSVELATLHGVRTFVRSSFDDPDAPELVNAVTPPGTLICDEDEIVEKKVVSGIAYTKDDAQISLRRVADKPGVAAAVFGPLAAANINVDMIVQNVSEDGTLTDLTFTVPIVDYDRARAVLEDRPRRSRLPDFAGLDRRGEGLGDRHRHAQSCRRRGRVFPGAGRPGDQHPGDHNVRNQDIGVDRCDLHRACGTDFAFAIRARQPLTGAHGRGR